MPKMTWDSAIALHPDRDPVEVGCALCYLESRGEVVIEQDSTGAWWVTPIPEWGRDATPAAIPATVQPISEGQILAGIIRARLASGAGIDDHVLAGLESQGYTLQAVTLILLALERAGFVVWIEGHGYEPTPAAKNLSTAEITPPTTTPPKPREPAPAVAVERVTEWLRGLQRERRISREMVKSVLAHFGASKVAELPADELENFRAIIEGEIK